MRKMFVIGAIVVLAGACAPGSSETAPGPVDAVEEVGGTSDIGQVDGIGDALAAPVADPEAAARGFRLYYRERVERAVVAYNRFMLFGDVPFATTIGKAGVARSGDDWEVVAGPNDNNRIGVSIRTTWYAYRVFRSRFLALSLIRMLEGLVFFEALSGHPGLTARMVYPGWTRVVDGAAGTVERTRGGELVVAPVAVDPALEAEMIAAFFNGFHCTWREDPEDVLLEYMPAREIGPYAVTYSFSMTPRYLRVSDCCTSLMRIPEGEPWAGAWFGNHNSRDNFPDLAMGYLVARQIMDDTDVDADLQETAARAWAAGQRVGDLIQTHEGRLMTVDEHNPYDTLVVAGAVRPDGETEAEDLGSLSDCQMVFLARALSTGGLSLPLPELPAPGSLEFLLADFLGGSCPLQEPVRTCTRLQEAYCGKDWSTIGELEFMGRPWLDAVAKLEADAPGAAEDLIGSFQDDFNEKTIAALALVTYAGAVNDEALLAEAQAALGEITTLLRFFGELLWARTQPDRLVERRYEAALFDAEGGLEVDPAELGDLARAEAQMARLEGMLDLPETPTEALRTDEEILALVEDRLAGASETTRERYLEHYGETPPLRRAGDGYEARGHHPEFDWPWKEVATPRHHQLGGVRLLEAIPLCVTAPHLLDCTWARLGCRRPDLDGSGAVDAVDQALLEAALAAHGESPCGAVNDWCGGADLDHTGTADAVDQAFMAAAQGCRYDP
ncbi:MAG: hypothetical protein ABIK09_14250 [Pseudomonadota bacterium]